MLSRLGERTHVHLGRLAASVMLLLVALAGSSGCGDGPPGATFWPQKAIGLAERANQRLGPSFPSRPY